MIFWNYLIFGLTARKTMRREPPGDSRRLAGGFDIFYDFLEFIVFEFLGRGHAKRCVLDLPMILRDSPEDLTFFYDVLEFI